ncbi:MAG TPA: hypothetical protein VG944_23275 [Fimbriimonas sp.]|nr:hypothetical protein [Fimbriimonas sp.]
MSYLGMDGESGGNHQTMRALGLLLLAFSAGIVVGRQLRGKPTIGA